MTNQLTEFAPSLAAAQDRLARFAPNAGPAYAQERNFDLGPGCHTHVSTLSPYLKIRALDEPLVARAVLERHAEADVEKFMAELFWRTYWKGWMELRPAVWLQYLQDLTGLRDEVQTQSGLRKRWEDACLGQTDIAPFDDWAHELVQTGYLHNHARMWFASVWIFTLDPPWQLVADFFLRHLLDGDAAVNTLSWRWVAGIQTPGKTYLARSENIAKFTGGRYADVKGLAQNATPLTAQSPPDVGPLPPCNPQPLPTRYVLLLHGDDIGSHAALQGATDPQAVGFAETTAGHSPWHMAPHVASFRQQMAQDALPLGTNLAPLTTAQNIADWAAKQNVEQIVAPYAPVGPVAAMFADYRALNGVVPLIEMRRPLDSAAWPLATKGFFPFRKNIPDLISRFAKS